MNTSLTSINNLFAPITTYLARGRNTDGSVDTSQGKKTCASFDCEGAKKVSTLIGCVRGLFRRSVQEGEHVNRLKVFRGVCLPW